MIKLKQCADESIVVTLGDQQIVIRLRDIDHEYAKLEFKAGDNVSITHKFSQVEYTD